MKTLILVAGKGLPRSDARETVHIAWDAAGEAALRARGLTFKSTVDYLGRDGADLLDEAAMAWVKDLGRVPLADGRTFRDLAHWRGVSLWWFAELYLYHDTRLPHAVRLIETTSRILAAERPTEVEVQGLSAVEELLVGRVCTTRGILFHGRRRPPRLGPAWRTGRISLASRWNSAKTVATAFKAWLGGVPPTRPTLAERTVLFLSHAAFWRSGGAGARGAAGPHEHYFDRLIPDVGAAPGLRELTVAVGPCAAFRRRRLVDCVGEWLKPQRDDAPFLHINRFTRPALVPRILRATREIRRLWRRLAKSSGLSAALSHRDVRFGDLAGPDLAATLLLQLPWAVRSLEEISEVLRASAPSLLCLYAESSGWGRAALAACRAAGVPTLALQHGILYPKYFSLRHDADEGDCPRPDVTAVYGESARRLLVEIGHNAPEALVATGAPKFDDLARTARSWDRAALRAQAGVGPADKLIVVAGRYRALRDTLQAIGPVFPDLVRAVDSLPGVVCLVKPHPAESADPYEKDAREVDSTRVRVLPPATDLMELMHAADLLVTVESSAAIEALILGRPVVVLNMPTHLGELVEKGVALGVAAGIDPRPTLAAALTDEATLERLRAARARYVDDLAMGVDGGATGRILALIRRAALPSVRATVEPR